MAADATADEIAVEAAVEIADEASDETADEAAAVTADEAAGATADEIADEASDEAAAVTADEATGDLAEVAASPSIAQTASPKAGLARPSSVLQQQVDSTRRAFNRADALVSLAQRYLRGDQPNRSPVEITVTIPAAALCAAAATAGARRGDAGSALPGAAKASIGTTGDADPAGTMAPVARGGMGDMAQLDEVGAAARAATVDDMAQLDEVGAAARAATVGDMAQLDEVGTAARAAAAGDVEQVGEMGESFISRDAARRLACDAGVIEIVEDEHGNPLSVGRKRRTVSGALKRALYRRDGACSYPGCTNRIFLEAHHNRHWADGGETSLLNTTLVCTQHHRHVHEYGYTVELGPDQRPRFRGPDGREIAAVPARPATAALGWSQIQRVNEPLAIDADTVACEWDGTPVDYGAVVDELVRVDGLG